MHSNFSLNLLAISLSLFLLSLPLQASELDDKIESSARQSYVFKSFLDDSITVHSEEGVVTLSGVVNEASHIALAENTVSGLPGVNSIINQLTVKESVS